MTYVDAYDDRDRYSDHCRCPCTQPNPVARIHTPERLEACLVEGRFGVSDLDVAASHFDLTYQRRGGGWVDEVLVAGRSWLRGAVWLVAPDRVNVETTSREAYEQVAEVVLALPTEVKKRSKREHDNHHRDSYYGYGYRQQRLHRGEQLTNRPTPGPAEVLEDLRAEHERRWTQRPHDLLSGVTPEEASKDEAKLYDLYDLLELAQVRGRDRVGLPPGADLDRVRESLGIGRRW